MSVMNFKHYKAAPEIDLENRIWPTRSFSEAPRWCSVDLRDGNQSLPAPMNFSDKVQLFNLLLEIGFKEIEVSFPAASETEFRFTRFLIDQKLIPEDVSIQVMSNARPSVIDRSFEAIAGAKRACVHFFWSTSPHHRSKIFQVSEADCIAKARDAAIYMRDAARRHEARYPGSKISLQYSAESFSLTEPQFAVELCDAISEVWAEDENREIIINLCNTLESASANYYADLVEYFCRHTRFRDRICVSVHSHNDRGTAVASSELALLAGAERVEGTLFGSGERAGNADLVTIALNFLTQGIDPELDLSDLKNCVRLVEASTQFKVASRQPYSGEDIYATFSGTHQDAIRKFYEARDRSCDVYEIWDSPYLPIDPADIGLDGERIIRINAQSGSSGIHYIMEEMYSLTLPPPLLAIFSKQIKGLAESLERELSYYELYQFFCDYYLNIQSPIKLVSFSDQRISSRRIGIHFVVLYNDRLLEIYGEGQGVLDAYSIALKNEIGVELTVVSYNQTAREEGVQSEAISYIGIQDGRDEHCVIYYGAGSSSNLTQAALYAMTSAINRYLKREQAEPEDFRLNLP
ncbi:MAG: 2-isopropylmalate synthase [Eubacteriales bacterium]|nr:2-isopropylmalate synthase [Eubacteriales bacterium]